MHNARTQSHAKSTVFRFDEEPVGTRVEHLRHVVGETIVPFDIRPGVRPAELRDRMTMGDVGPVRFSQNVLSPTEILRTPRLIRRSDPEMYKVDLLVSGHAVIEQSGRQCRLDAGDMSFVDLSRPGRWVVSTADLIVVMFPRELMPLSRRDVERLAAIPISGRHGVGALAASLARQVAGNLDDYEGAERASIGSAFLDLLSTTLAARVADGNAVPPQTRQRSLVLRVHAYIEQRLADPALSPAAIAAAHHISVRYLHKLFEAQEMTVAERIRRCRLERCRRDLLDPALRGRPVSAIGARWGLPNAIHFSRVFRARYGVPPGEYRQTWNAPSPP